MKKFEVIKNKIYCVKRAGYELDCTSPAESRFPECFNEYRRHEEFDSFFELYNVALCKDEKDELYAVKFYFATNEPMIWQRVRRVPCDLTKTRDLTYKLFDELVQFLKGTKNENRYSIIENDIEDVLLTDIEKETEVKGHKEIQIFIQKLLKEKNTPAFMTEWRGSMSELFGCVEHVVNDIQETMDIRISAKDMRKLFLDAFSRNVVQNEIRSVIADILKDTDIFFEG